MLIEHIEHIEHNITLAFQFLVVVDGPAVCAC